jgi:hypothetical protein
MKYWSQIILGFSQLEGMYRGYTYAITKEKKQEEMKMSIADFLIIQADGEVGELLTYLTAKETTAKVGEPNYFNKAFGDILQDKTDDPILFWKQIMWTSKCSAFMKIVKDDNGNWKDLYSGHTTWTEYYEMLRQYKQ